MASTLKIDADFSICNLAKIRRDIDTYLGETHDQSEITIDLCNVVDFDTAAIQFLLSLKKHCASSNKTLNLLGLSPQISGVLTVLNLDDSLNKISH